MHHVALQEAGWEAEGDVAQLELQICTLAGDLEEARFVCLIVIIIVIIIVMIVIIVIMLVINNNNYSGSSSSLHAFGRF